MGRSPAGLVGPAPESAGADAVAAIRASGAALAGRLPAPSAGEDSALARLASKTPRFAVANLDAWLALEERVASKRDDTKRLERERELGSFARLGRG